MNDNDIEKKLASSNPQDHLEALKMVMESPSGNYLDQLWDIHVSMQTHPEKYIENPKYKFRLYEKSYSPLQLCVKKNPDWLENKINQADSETEPVHDLAYILASLERSDIWDRCKDVLAQKIKGDKIRSRIRNMYVYRDSSEIDWLETQLDKQHDLIDASAFQAIARIDVDRAVKCLPKINPLTLLVTKTWTLKPLLILRHAKVLDYINSQGASASFGEMNLFQDLEIYADDVFVNRTLTYCSEKIDPSSTRLPVYFLHRFFSRMNSTWQLNILENQKGSDLENKLLDYVNHFIGTLESNNRWASWEASEVMTLLQKINGDGYVKAINAWLRCNNQYYRHEDGIENAIKKADEETFSELVRTVQSDRSWEENSQVPVEQIRAMRVLGAWKKTDLLLEGMKKLGLSTPNDLTNWKLTEDYSDSETADKCLKDIQERGDITVGAILALGKIAPSGVPKYYELISDILEHASDREIKTACIISLGLLKAGSERILTLLTRFLDDPKLCTLVIRAFIYISTEESLTCLLSHIQLATDKSYALSVVANLFPRPGAWEYIKQCLEEKVCPTGSNFEDQLISVLSFIDENEFDKLFTDYGQDQQAIEAYLDDMLRSDEGSFWVIAAKFRTGQILGRLNKETAFDAILYNLNKTTHHDRVLYPELLIKFDPERGFDELIKLAIEEKSCEVLWGISRAINQMEFERKILELLDAEDDKLRLAVCRICAKLIPKSSIARKLQDILKNDNNWRISEVAADSLQYLRESIEAEKIVESFRQETDYTRRWLLLDAAIGLGDPGHENGQWPKWIEDISSIIGNSFFMKHYFFDKLKKSQKKMKKQASDIKL